MSGDLVVLAVSLGGLLLAPALYVWATRDARRWSPPVTLPTVTLEPGELVQLADGGPVLEVVALTARYAREGTKAYTVDLIEAAPAASGRTTL